MGALKVIGIIVIVICAISIVWAVFYFDVLGIKTAIKNYVGRKGKKEDKTGTTDTEKPLM